jgi:hypothetical protein
MVLECVHQRHGTGLTTCRACGPYSGSGRIAYQRLDLGQQKRAAKLVSRNIVRQENLHRADIARGG